MRPTSQPALAKRRRTLTARGIAGVLWRMRSVWRVRSCGCVRRVRGVRLRGGGSRRVGRIPCYILHCAEHPEGQRTFARYNARSVSESTLLLWVRTGQPFCAVQELTTTCLSRFPAALSRLQWVELRKKINRSSLVPCVLDCFQVAASCNAIDLQSPHRCRVVPHWGFTDLCQVPMSGIPQGG